MAVAEGSRDSDGSRADWADLLHRWEARSPRWSTARKRESFERVLARFSGDPEKLHVRLRGLLRSWNLPQTAAAAEAEPLLPAPAGASAVIVAGRSAPPTAAIVPTLDTKIEPTLAATDPRRLHRAVGQDPGCHH